jgi:hypothetical protein
MGVAYILKRAGKGTWRERRSKTYNSNNVPEVHGHGNAGSARQE